MHHNSNEGVPVIFVFMIYGKKDKMLQLMLIGRLGDGKCFILAKMSYQIVNETGCFFCSEGTVYGIERAHYFSADGIRPSE